MRGPSVRLSAGKTYLTGTSLGEQPNRRLVRAREGSLVWFGGAHGRPAVGAAARQPIRVYAQVASRQDETFTQITQGV